MADPQAILRFLRDPNLQTGPYPQWPVMPPMQPGAQLRNPAPRPSDAMAPVSEALSPTMGGYGMGQIAADTLMKAQQGDYAGVAANAPFIVGALKGPVRIPNPIKAFHGSPHDFKPTPGNPLGEFDLSKIGTGEGAQAYGHGLYFAENEGVAQSYKGSLDDVGIIAGSYLRAGGGDKAKALEFARRDLNAWNPRASSKQRSDLINQVIARINGEGPQGHMYEVALHATPESFLDYDRPLSEQPAAVREFVAKYHPEAIANNPDMKGGAIWKGSDVIMGRTPEGQSEAANKLGELGVPGVRYLDQQSRRNTGEQTHNYAVWSPEIIEILRKYGIIAAPTAGAIANAVAPPPQQ